MINCKKLAQKAKIKEPATLEEISQAQIALGHKFPKTYRELLSCSNGLEVDTKRKTIDYLTNKTGETNSDTILLYSTKEIEERNSTYQVSLYAPNLILIGSNGGGKGIFLDCSTEDSPVCFMGLGDIGNIDSLLKANNVDSSNHLSIYYDLFLSSNIEEWLENDFDLKELPKIIYPEFVDLYFVRSPVNGAKDLLRIKKEIALPISIGELYTAFTKAPSRILRRASFQNYARRCAVYNQKDNCLGLFEVDQPNRSIPTPSPVPKIDDITWIHDR